MVTNFWFEKPSNSNNIQVTHTAIAVTVKGTMLIAPEVQHSR